MPCRYSGWLLVGGSGSGRWPDGLLAGVRRTCCQKTRECMLLGSNLPLAARFRHESRVWAAISCRYSLLGRGFCTHSRHFWRQLLETVADRWMVLRHARVPQPQSLAKGPRLRGPLLATSVSSRCARRLLPTQVLASSQSRARSLPPTQKAPRSRGLQPAVISFSTPSRGSSSRLRRRWACSRCWST